MVLRLEMFLCLLILKCHCVNVTYTPVLVKVSFKNMPCTPDHGSIVAETANPHNSNEMHTISFTIHPAEYLLWKS